MIRDAVVGVTLLVFALALFFTAVVIPFGSPAMSDMDDYFIKNGQEEAGTNNIVTAVLFDYRGFDTLGEASVLFTAVTGVGILFRLRKKEEES